MPKVLSVQICTSHRSPMKKVAQAKLIVNLGIDKDIHSTSEDNRKHRQIVLMDIETLNSFNLETGIIKENITTEGVNINNLKENQEIHIGDSVILSVAGPCDPCPRMDEIRPGLMKDLEGQRGTLAFVQYGGTIKVGDKIEIKFKNPDKSIG